MSNGSAGNEKRKAEAALDDPSASTNGNTSRRKRTRAAKKKRQDETMAAMCNDNVALSDENVALSRRVDDLLRLTHALQKAGDAVDRDGMIFRIEARTHIQEFSCADLNCQEWATVEDCWGGEKRMDAFEEALNHTTPGDAMSSYSGASVCQGACHLLPTLFVH